MRCCDISGSLSARDTGTTISSNKEGVPKIINLQPRGGKGKPYQMKQVRQILLRYHMMED